MKLLLVEDDQFLANGLSLVLQNGGYFVDHVSNGCEAEAAALVNEYDLIILDLGLPGKDGLDILKDIRNRGRNTPVLILTARESLEDRVTGLDLGANDYLTKPFEIPELEARVRALLRKDNWSNRVEVNFGAISFDTVKRIVSVDKSPIELTARELSVLEVLLRFADSTVSRQKLSDRLSSLEDEISDNAVGIVIHRLRKKLEPFGVSIRALRGLGYRLELSGPPCIIE